MSSEALEPPFDREQILGRVNVVERGETTLYERALLAEVARLERAAEHAEQQRAEYAKAWVDQQFRLQEAEAALAVARERGQRAAKALAQALDCKGSFNGTVSQYGGDPALCTKCAAAARAALVDEPAAATAEVAAILATGPDPRDDALLRIWTAARMNTAESLRNFVLDVVPRVIPAAATLAEPGVGEPLAGESPRNTDAGRSELAARSLHAPGSAIAAADEPGETPCS